MSCALVTLEAFSCRVTNEFFVDVVNTCTTVQRKLSDLESGQRFLALYEKHPDWGKPEKLMATYIDLCKEMMGLRNALADKLAKIAACPTPNDKIH